jgi:cardiolipin synthase
MKAMEAKRPEFFNDGEEIRLKMLALIHGATDYILIDSFLVTGAGPAREVLDALKAKRQEGVRVYILADYGSRHVPEEAAFDYLEETGIPYAEFNPLTPATLALAPVLLIRDHRKFWIVDGKVLFLGGANITANSLMSRGAGGNRDLMTAVESPEAVAKMVEAFVKTWNESSSLRLDVDDFAIPVQKEPSGKVRIWLINQQFAGEPSNILPMVDGLFSTVRKEIWVLQAYTLANPELTKMIKAASQRGVSVNFILGEPATYPKFHYSSYYGIKSILDAGGKVWIHQSGKSPLHYKTILVDDHLVEVGSANLNFRSYHLSKEACLVIEDKASAKKIKALLQDILANSREMTLKEAHSYRNPRYFLGWLLMQLGG